MGGSCSLGMDLMCAMLKALRDLSVNFYLFGSFMPHSLTPSKVVQSSLDV